MRGGLQKVYNDSSVKKHTDDKLRGKNKGLIYLVAYCTLGFYAFFTVMYHMADLAAGLGLDPADPVAAVAMKFRAGIDCRDSALQTGDESCYDRWHV